MGVSLVRGEKKGKELQARNTAYEEEASVHRAYGLAC